MEDLTHIQVFKTNVRTEEDKALLKKVLDLRQEVEEWSVDCEDIDCVLRVVSHELGMEEILQLVRAAGFHCDELE